MPLYPESSFTNIQVLVGTPPAFERNPVPAQEYLEAYWYVTQGTLPLPKDDCQTLSTLAYNFTVPLKFLVKQLVIEPNSYDDVNEEGVATLDEEPDFTVIDNIKPMWGFDGPGDSVLRAALLSGYARLPTGIVNGETLALMSTPYLSDLAVLRQNGLRDMPGGQGRSYLWEVQESQTFSDTFGGREAKTNFKVVGDHIVCLPLAKDFKSPLAVILNVVEAEGSGAIKDGGFANEEVNAFTLFMSIYPGTHDNLPPAANNADPAVTQNAQPKWNVKIKIASGDLFFEIDEGKNSLGVHFVGGLADVGTDVINLPLDVSRSVVTASMTGQKKYALTFIPVWNGIIVTDQIPGSVDFGSALYYVRLDNEQDIYSAITELMENLSNGEPPRYGPDRENLANGLFIEDSAATRLDTGEAVEIEFTNCGGTFQFRPVFFAPDLRSYFIMSGESSDTIEEGDNEECSPVVSFFDASDMNRVGNFTLLPVFHIDISAESFPEEELGYEWKLGVPITGPPPVWCIGQRFVQPLELRRPIETWGFILYGTQQMHNSYSTDEGSLSNEDVPQELIQAVEVSRSIDGTSSGSITWDYYDPINGLLRRPDQHVGAIRIGVIGGQDTMPGVIFTGIGMGNSEHDEHDSNTIHIPLKGRDVKLRDDAFGLRLINSPFFDGFDHRAVLQWLCDYAGIPYLTFSNPYPLPTGSILNPAFNYMANTAVWTAITEVAERAGTVVYFDRFGVLRQYNVGQTTGQNWTLTSDQVLSYSDEPDLTSVNNTFVVCGLVLMKNSDAKELFLTGKLGPEAAQLRFAYAPVQTNPMIPWSKMSFYTLQGILNYRQFRLAAQKVIFGQTRARATSSMSIPGNSEIELLDTINETWVVTQISHNINLSQKMWQTSLQLELLVGVPSDQQEPTQAMTPIGTDSGSGAGVDTSVGSFEEGTIGEILG